MAYIRVIKDEIYKKEITRKNALMYERRKQFRNKKKYKYKKNEKNGGADDGELTPQIREIKDLIYAARSIPGVDGLVW